MDSPTRPADPELLFAQRAWVKHLAAGLVGEADADDLAQEAMIRAMERPPRADSAARPWLRSVVRNLAAQWKRTEARRSYRQAAAARSEALPSTEELSARAELQRILVEEVLALDQSTKTVVLLRYFEGLSAAEIARRTGAAGSDDPRPVGAGARPPARTTRPPARRTARAVEPVSPGTRPRSPCDASSGCAGRPPADPSAPASGRDSSP